VSVARKEGKGHRKRGLEGGERHDHVVAIREREHSFEMWREGELRRERTYAEIQYSLSNRD
jgi:hypothetical protein